MSGDAAAATRFAPPAGMVNADAEPASFVVELTHFSGPLDLLLTLLRDDQIDISDIPVARVAEQFLERIRTLRLDEAAEYLEMAARLLRIKAQMLLPRREGEEPWEDPRAELVRHLLEYQQVREVVDVLEIRAEARRNRFGRALLLPPERPSAPARFAVTLSELLAAVDRVLRIALSPTAHAVVPRALDVAGALGAARALLARRGQLRWRDLVRGDAEAWQILSVLLAVLELARLGECILRQPTPFGPLEISPPSRSPSSSIAAPVSDLPARDVATLNAATAHDSAGAAA